MERKVVSLSSSSTTSAGDDSQSNNHNGNNSNNNDYSDSSTFTAQDSILRNQLRLRNLRMSNEEDTNRDNHRHETHNDIDAATGGMEGIEMGVSQHSTSTRNAAVGAQTISNQSNNRNQSDKEQKSRRRHATKPSNHQLQLRKQINCATFHLSLDHVSKTSLLQIQDPITVSLLLPIIAPVGIASILTEEVPKMTIIKIPILQNKATAHLPNELKRDGILLKPRVELHLVNGLYIQPQC